MATREEMLAELEMLRAKMAEADARERAVATESKDTSERSADDAPEQAAEDVAHDAADRAEAQSELNRLLRPLGVSEEELQTLARQLWKELDTLPQNKPLLTAIAAFGVGFVVGRMTK